MLRSKPGRQLILRTPMILPKLFPWRRAMPWFFARAHPSAGARTFTKVCLSSVYLATLQHEHDSEQTYTSCYSRQTARVLTFMWILFKKFSSSTQMNRSEVISYIPNLRHTKPCGWLWRPNGLWIRLVWVHVHNLIYASIVLCMFWHIRAICWYSTINGGGLY